MSTSSSNGTPGNGETNRPDEASSSRSNTHDIVPGSEVNGTSHAQDRPQPDDKDIIDVSTAELQTLDADFLYKLEGDELKTMGFDTEERGRNEDP